MTEFNSSPDNFPAAKACPNCNKLAEFAVSSPPPMVSVCPIISVNFSVSSVVKFKSFWLRATFWNKSPVALIACPVRCEMLYTSLITFLCSSASFVANLIRPETDAHSSAMPIIEPPANVAK